MVSTLLQLVNEVLRRKGQVEASTLVNAGTPAVQTRDFLNEVYFEMLQRLKVDRLIKQASFNTTANTAAYTLATDADVNSLLPDSLLETASQRGLAQTDSTYPLEKGTSAVGRPDHFYVQGNSLYLYPTPDAAYTINYQYGVKPSALSNDTDTTALPAEWEKVLVLGTQARLEQFLGEPGAEGTYFLYQEGLVQLRYRASRKPHHRMKGDYRGYPC